MSISNLLTGGAQVGADLSINCHNVICDAESVFEAGLKTDTISEQTAGAGVNVDGVLLKDGQVAGSFPYFRAVKASGNILNASSGALNGWDSASGGMAGDFNLVDGFFYPPITGIYQFTGQFTFGSGGGSATDMRFRLSPAGGGIAIGTYTSGFGAGSSVHMSLSGGVLLTAGTYYYLTVYQTIATPLAATNFECSAVLLARV
jgi:hypothetical protein